MDAKDPKYQYKRFGMEAKRVGQAVVDILSKEQPNQTVEETLEQMAPEYLKQMEIAIQEGSERHQNPFYVLVFTHKEMWAANVMRNWFVSRTNRSTCHRHDL